MFRLKLRLLGPPQVELDDRPLEIKRRKVLALLAYLALSEGPQRRDNLATLLWPDSSQRRARGALRRHLSELNQLLGGDGLETDRETTSLRRGPELALDVAQFRTHLAACREHDHPPEVVCPDCLPRLAEAAALYRADFLSGFTLSDSPEFDDWQYFQAESLRQVTGTYAGDLTGKEIWILVYPPNVVYYPQSEDACRSLPAQFANGQWSTIIRLGRPNVPEAFHIVAVVTDIDSPASEAFHNYLEVGCTTESYNGLSLIPEGATELDSIIVHTQ